MSRHQLDNLVKQGELVAIAPSTYCRPWDQDLPEVHERAASAHIGRCAISDVSALRRYRLIREYTLPVHVCVSASHMPRSRPGLIVHRVQRFPAVVRLDSVVTVSASTALATSWPMLAGPDQRGPIITACRDKLVRPKDLIDAVAGLPRLRGRRQMMSLVTLLAEGCESELEIWGHTEVFNVAGLRHASPQLVVGVRGRSYRLDRPYLAEKVDVELDGAAFHGSKEQRERDLARDAALSSAGWLVVRFSHRRLHCEPDGCRRDLLAVLASRR